MFRSPLALIPMLVNVFLVLSVLFFAKNEAFDTIFGHSDNNRKDASTCEECGLANERVKIVGGSSATKNEYPWIVTIHDAGDFVIRGSAKSQFCGGAILTKHWVLTAAHCISDYKKTPLLLVIGVGRHNLDNFFDSFVLPKTVASVKIHPQYNTHTQEFDAGLIQLVIPITFTDTIRPVCLAQTDYDISGKNMVVAGWGSTSEGGPSSTILQEVQVEGISIAQCNAYYNDFDVNITRNMVCAGYANGGKDACQGDSGGPLMQKCGDRYTLVGLVSFGIGCAQPQLPGVYTKVFNLKPWIDTTIGKSQFCSHKCQVFS